MFEPVKGATFEDFSATRLVVASPTTGSVASLTVDLLIHNNQDSIKKIGYYYTQSLKPWVGQIDLYSTGPTLSLNAEVFQDAARKVTYLQFRSWIKKGLKKTFYNEFLAFLTKYKFIDVILLGSLDYDLRPDYEIKSPAPNVYVTHADAYRGPLDASRFLRVQDAAQKLHETGETLIGAPLVAHTGKRRADNRFNTDVPIVSLLVFAQSKPDVRATLALIQSVAQELKYGAPAGGVKYPPTVLAYLQEEG